MERFRRLFLPVDSVDTDPPPARRAAVAVIVGPTAGHASSEMLFIRRAEREGDPWSGDMAFPGGRAEPDDADLCATALRETVEEIGWALPREALVGALPVLRSPVRRPGLSMSVHPFLFVVDAWPEHFLLSGEVARVHRLHVEQLLAEDGRGAFLWEGRGAHVPPVPLELPRVDVDGQRIWGMTLRVLDDLLARVRAGTPAS